jgi:hypothetical protein
MNILKVSAALFIANVFFLASPAKLHAQQTTPVQQSLMMQSLGSDAQRTQLLQIQDFFASMGPTMQHLISMTYVGGRLQREQQQVFNYATGGRSGQFMAALRRLRTVSGLSQDDPQRISAEDEIVKFQEFLTAYIESPKFARTVMIVQDPTIRTLLMQVQGKQ